MDNIKRYINGNCITTIDTNNGTKIHETIDPNCDHFDFAFSESCDLNITNKCDNGCAWCYQGCTKDGAHADLNSPFLATLHPYTELAINGNDLSHPDLIPFLERMKKQDILVSMTVNQRHFEKYEEMIKDMLSKGLIKGLGVSLVYPTKDFITKIKNFPTAVIHVIAGLISKEDLDTLAGNNLKILVLGYKSMKNRGKDFYEDGHKEEIENKISWLSQNLEKYYSKFEVIAFDNLAITQLDLENKMSKKDWEERYMGNDGEHTFFIDLVAKKFARTSISEKQYDLLDNIDDMFKVIKEEKCSDLI